ncbi:hypothetical protein ACVWZV_008978 [Bradyrhizobium sp. GM5.1]
MADLRQDEKSAQKKESAGEKTAEQTRQTQAGEEVVQASTDLLQQNLELLQNSCRFGVEVATAMMGRSTDQLGRTFGLFEAQRATERSARNAGAIMYSASAVAKGMNGASREYFEFVRQRIDRSMDRMNELWRCRTPHDLAAVQTDSVRDAIRSAMETSRRIADMSLKVADDAGNHIAQSVERMQHTS